MQFMDTHIHLQDFKHKDTPDIIIQGANCGVGKMICVSAKETDWEKVAQAFEQFPSVIVPAFGLHPWYVTETSVDWQSRLESLLQKYPQALVGEVGLDKIHSSKPEPQKEFFQIQIDLAKKYARPLLIHAVHATGWLDDYWQKLPPKCVFHAFNSKKTLLEKALNSGGYISFSSSILKHPKKEELVSLVPIEKMLIETDAPFQSQTVCDLPIIATEIAKSRGMLLEDFAQQIYQNSLELTNVE